MSCELSSPPPLTTAAITAAIATRPTTAPATSCSRRRLAALPASACSRSSRSRRRRSFSSWRLDTRESVAICALTAREAGRRPGSGGLGAAPAPRLPAAVEELGDLAGQALGGHAQLEERVGAQQPGV